MIVVFFSGFEMYQISVCRGLMLGFSIKGDINVIAQQLLPSLHTERSETQKKCHHSNHKYACSFYYTESLNNSSWLYCAPALCLCLCLKCRLMSTGYTMPFDVLFFCF